MLIGKVDNGSREPIVVPGVFSGIAGMRGRDATDGRPLEIAFLPVEDQPVEIRKIIPDTPILVGGDPYRVISAFESDIGNGRTVPMVRLNARPDPLPRASHAAATELDGSTLEALAEMICGNDEARHPRYRSGPALTRFFNAAGLARFVHDGSTRFTWVLTALEQCTPDEIIQVIERLATPREYRGDASHIASALSALNEVLAGEGLIVTIEAGKPRVTRRSPRSDDQHPFADTLAEMLANFDMASVSAAWAKATARASTDPSGAITSARTLVEEVCKAILVREGVAIRPTAELPSLHHEVVKLLRLAPTDDSEVQFRQLMGSCQAVVSAIAMMRNRFGDAHAQGEEEAAAVRHAQLAVNLAGSMSLFLISSYLAR